MRHILFILFVTLFVNGYSQKDKAQKSKSPTQTYQISSELQYIYPRPKLFNFINGIPNKDLHQ